MTKKQTNKPRRRTQVKDLPGAETKLTEKEMKKIKGGYELENAQISSVVAPKTRVPIK